MLYISDGFYYLRSIYGKRFGVPGHDFCSTYSSSTSFALGTFGAFRLLPTEGTPQLREVREWRGAVEENHAKAEQTTAIANSLRFMLNMTLARGWMTWRRAWKKGKRTRGKLMRAASRLANAPLARSWRSWQLMASERAEALYRLRNAVVSIWSRKLALGFRTWVECAAACVAALVSIHTAVAYLMNAVEQVESKGSGESEMCMSREVKI